MEKPFPQSKNPLTFHYVFFFALLTIEFALRRATSEKVEILVLASGLPRNLKELNCKGTRLLFYRNI